MNHVYEKGSCVLVWLGPDEQSLTHDAFRSVERVAGLLAKEEASPTSHQQTI